MQRIRSHFLSLVALGLCLQGSVVHADPLDTWTWRNPLPTGDNLTGIAYGNGRFVAVGRRGTILISTDGVDWVLHQPGIQFEGEDIIFGDGRFLIVDGLGRIWISSDGVDWAPVAQEPISPSPLAYGGGQFVAFGGPEGAFTSTDGTNWVQHSEGLGMGSIGFGYEIIYEGGQFVAVGTTYPAGTPAVLTSANGIDWVQRQAGTTNGPLNGVSYGDGQYVAVGDGGTVVTSVDGIYWCRWQ